MNQYPKMIYPAGDATKPGRVVRDADEEKAAEKDGFLEAGTKKPAKAK
jgi:hypothetical protein